MSRLDWEQSKVFFRKGTLFTDATIEKNGRTLHVVGANGQGRLIRLCHMACCHGKETWEKYKLLPCECHDLVRYCTCPLKDKQCRKCERVFVPVGLHVWYQVDDPHQRPVTAVNVVHVPN